jgi:hypothetical protein
MKQIIETVALPVFILDENRLSEEEKKIPEGIRLFMKGGITKEELESIRAKQIQGGDFYYDDKGIYVSWVKAPKKRYNCIGWGYVE